MGDNTQTKTYAFEVDAEEMDTLAWDNQDYVHDAYVKPWVEKLKARWVVKGYTTHYQRKISNGAFQFDIEALVVPKYGFNECHNCGNEIKVAIFRGSGVCSDNCRKALGEDIK